MKTDRLIIGAGLYGLYAALYCVKQGYRVVIIECENAPFKRATYINQARVHQGYHYPRSISTALKSAKYFERFNADYSFCINKEFEQIYATSSHFSWTNGQRFKEFCNAAGIACEELHPGNYFKEGLCDGAFMTREYTYDAVILRDYFLSELAKYGKKVEFKLGEMITGIIRDGDEYVIRTQSGSEYRSGFVLNATYASTNQISEMAGFDKFKIKYELCEIILCDVNERMRNIGFTVMDGPFFSIMPFGKTGLHSLTSVTFTPHTTSYGDFPVFQCQAQRFGDCSEKHLANCNECTARPQTAYPYMRSLAEKYLLEDYRFEYKKSLFSIKPILLSSEIDDSRPTVIRKYSDKPTFISVLSGKINTVYDLNEVLENE